jgi:hypothetical protein
LGQLTSAAELFGATVQPSASNKIAHTEAICAGARTGGNDAEK